MASHPRALTEISTDALRTLLSAVHKKVIAVPLSIGELTRIGLQYCATDLMRELRDLDERAVRTVLVAVIAERSAQEEAARRSPRQLS
jgi:hypothetical protein